MKKALRLFITGNLQSLFYRESVKNHALEHNVNGFLRLREDGRIEIFLEGESEDVDTMASICKRGPQYSTIRKIEEKEEKLQDFKEFKILKF